MRAQKIMLSPSSIISYADFILVTSGTLFVMAKFGQQRIPMKRPSPAIFTLQMTLMCHFFLRAGIDAYRQNSPLFMLFLDLFVGALLLVTLIWQFIQLVHRLPDLS